ncbi:hypothetical protein K505DRAFT_248366 [Melanomma pulvis-pyrius CBS 109.77]|uniref:Protein kinase domain-containing protein n=1 Tax=Melanomma pulvis-pyrius CBS 109.77 TaxID=1314802 RepID=A0A6A6X704_9PLEO|nr:hypothetical protein K505DRAFT_248366 [Melanomma pulvis-pyrius CBS 109.77]
MSEYSFPSAFSSAPLTAPPHFSHQADSNIHKATISTSKYTERTGNLSSFVCHVLYLQKKLRDEEGLGGFIDDNVERVISRAKLGEGHQFTVYSAQASFKRPMRHINANDPGQIIAVKVLKTKVAKPMVDEDDNPLHNWSSILLEVRALMHEHLRYHPNIVRLLGFTWAPGLDSPTGAMYPMLVMEYARFGSLKSLQALSAPLSFAVKQKLCHDVARGLSILHACGIIHSDLKHENVLVFDNPYEEPPGQPYLAKLADFGGAVMDMKYTPSQSLKLGTIPYQAPEVSEELSANDLKKTDVYSFGLLFWRTLLDGKNLFEELWLASDALKPEVLLWHLKKEDKKMLDRAFESIGGYLPRGASIETLELISFVLRRTLRTDPAERNLAAAQAALRNGHVKGIAEHLADMEIRNRNETFELQDGIQRQAFNVDRIGFQLGQRGDFYDAQQNLPGYRSELPHPAAGQFLFEPMNVKSLLSWEQQVEIVKELKSAARAKDEVSPLGIPPFKAAFYVFQSYLAEFGVAFDANEVCYWLSLAAEPDDKWEDEIFAQAWLWRVCNALQCPQPVSVNTSIQYLRNSIVCGFKECARDWKAYIEMLTDASEKQRQMKLLKKYQNMLQTYAGGVGMWYYFPRTIRKKYNLFNLDVLDQQIREELGEHHEQCLLTTDQSNFEKADEIEHRFDKIYVSSAGHGLLHFAATFGKVDVLKHLLDTYKCDVDRASTFRYDTPLVCAVRSAQYDCAMFLLQQGAQPGMVSDGGEGPLHCLCGFEAEQEEEMRTVAKHLIDAGADIEELSSTSGSRGIAADWDRLLDISTTPLGRAVISRNNGAIKVLLDLGADPRGKGRPSNEEAMSPVEIAGMLFYPEVLETLLQRSGGHPHTSLFDEAWVLKAAHERKKNSVDPSCLQSRLVYLGDADIVEALLELGHDPNGTEEFRPLQAAATTRNWRVFKLLLRFGADVHQRYLHHPDVRMTFLHAIAWATQGSRTPDGVKIAEDLLAAGVPVELPLEQCPITPFAQCVINCSFDVADVLFAHGAEFNPVYARPPGQGPPISLLGGLVIQPNETTLESIHYLKKLGSHLSPIGIPSCKMSVLHQVAHWTHDTMAYNWLASIEIMKLLLSTFDDADIINEWYPGVLTPLGIAAMNLNVDFVRMLLEKKADPSIGLALDHAGLEILSRGVGVERTPIRGTPLCMCLMTYEAILVKIESASSALVNIAPIEYLFSMASKIVQLLLPLSQDEGALELWTALQVRGDELMTAKKQATLDTKGIMQHDDKPVDLSALTEERPSGWSEGCEMTDEMTLRIFLHHMRNDFPWPDL